jgi:hypothetical protein
MRSPFEFGLIEAGLILDLAPNTVARLSRSFTGFWTRCRFHLGFRLWEIKKHIRISSDLQLLRMRRPPQAEN